MRPYQAFLRREPRARAYLAASLIDDVGIAISAWAAALMMTNLATTQRARASFMLPTLVCFLLGSLIAGPLADWARTDLARFRWKLVLWGRAIETALLAYLVVELSRGTPTIARVLPYVMVAAFMKTALRPTRIAFSVDLLDDESPGEGVDERGQPVRQKTHLLAFSSLTGFFATIAALGGLVAGGAIMKAAAGRTHWLFAADVATNIGFIVVVALRCKPPRDDGERNEHPGVLRHFFDGFRFLFAPAQRPLLAMLAGAWIVEVVAEAYDGRMVIKHVLHGSDDAVRWAQIVWSIVAAVGAALLPALVRSTRNVGKIFLVTMLLDGVVIMCAGQAAAIVPFTVAIAVDRSLTLASDTLTGVAQNSVSSAAMRGRIAGTYAIFVILGDMASEALAAAAEARWGIPGLITRVGFVQVVLVLAIAALGGRKLWGYGLRPASAAVPA